MNEYEKQQLEKERRKKDLYARVKEWFDKHPDARFCGAEYPVAGNDKKIVGIEKVADGVFCLKNWPGGTYPLDYWGLDLLASVVSAMSKD
jgi:hypothetical protein